MVLKWLYYVVSILYLIVRHMVIAHILLAMEILKTGYSYLKNLVLLLLYICNIVIISLMVIFILCILPFLAIIVRFVMLISVRTGRHVLN